MSGPVETGDLPTADAGASGATLEVTQSRIARVGASEVRRALPNRQRRSVGAWCFVDHFGPSTVTDREHFDIGPHPHMGLQTVTWLLEGEVLHHDSLGSEQLIRPGQLNLMTAGHAVAHAEHGRTPSGGVVHGVQLWVAQPESTRHGAAAFEHHRELPVVDLDAGAATVLVGSLGAAVSPARRDTEHLGFDLDLRAGSSSLPLDPRFEHAVVVTSGALRIGSEHLAPGQLAYLGTGRDELEVHVDDTARALLLGGLPFEDELVMWWNFVARSRDEIDAAFADWSGDTGRFGAVASPLPRMETAPPFWH